MNGGPLSPTCPHCLCGPCIVSRQPAFLVGMARPSLTNRTKRFRLYRKFWQLLSYVGFWHHPMYLRRKQARTVVHDEREIMPQCIQDVRKKEHKITLMMYIYHRKYEEDFQTLKECRIQGTDLPLKPKL